MTPSDKLSSQMLCNLGSVCTTQSQRQRRKLNLQVFLRLATVHFQVTVSNWYMAAGMWASSQSQREKRKTQKYLCSLSVPLTKRTPSSRLEPKPREGKMQRGLFLSLSLSPLLPIIPLSSKGSVLYTRESLATVGIRVTALCH